MVPEDVLAVDDLPGLVGDADLVLLGEATHGTHEFYAVRAELTRRLVAEHGFRGLAVEADGPAAARADRYIRGDGGDRSAADALGATAGWMWRNHVVADLVDWLSRCGTDAGFHGLDLAHLHHSNRSRPDAWNLRETHMADTLDALRAHTTGGRLVVWAHNSHVGDARATETAALGELSLGQLVRDRHGDAARLVGFTTHAGTVTAARDWGGPPECRRLRPSLDGSVERLLHDAGLRAGVLDLRRGVLPDLRFTERMVGVVYRPRAEIWNHYLSARPAGQFDLLVHIDETTALEPLDGWAAIEEPAAAAYP